MKDRRTIFSPCRKYRYTLWREWDMMNPTYCQFIGLNPSTADEVQDDPTIRRCIDYAKRWGFGALCMTNAFAWRETDPEKMKAQSAPIGETTPDFGSHYQVNDEWLERIARGAGIVIAAWGRDGSHLKRDRRIIELLGDKLFCLGTNGDGTPKHPLYLSKTLKLIPFSCNS